MSTAKILHPEPLTKKAFLPFGQVLQTEGVSPVAINLGHTQKFDNLAEVHLGDGGRGQLSIYRSQAITLPFRIRLLERHPLGSQAFYPLHKRPFPVIVSSSDNPSDIRVFLSNGSQGVNINPGVWHHYQLTLGQESEYIVFDRHGGDDNYEECWLHEEVSFDL